MPALHVHQRNSCFEDHRSRVAQEMYDTEKAYVTSLKVVKTVCASEMLRSSFHNTKSRFNTAVHRSSSRSMREKGTYRERAGRHCGEYMLREQAYLPLISRVDLFELRVASWSE